MNVAIPSLFERHTIKWGRAAIGLVAAFWVAGCSNGQPPQGINDPNEGLNRKIHALNTGVDKALLRPAAGSYGQIVPEPLMIGISNVGDNLGGPGDVANYLMQGRPGPAFKSTLRFAINSTIGVAGLFDPASVWGLTAEPTDFGETLHVWGVAEGAYVELPFDGPSTERDFVGKLVDGALDPLSHVLPADEADFVRWVRLGSKLGDRSRYAATVDSILYDSADSYAQARLLYLQNRRFELAKGDKAAGGASGDDFLDPYAEDQGADAAFEDPYADFEDPYAQ